MANISACPEHFTTAPQPPFPNPLCALPLNSSVAAQGKFAECCKLDALPTYTVDHNTYLYCNISDFGNEKPPVQKCFNNGLESNALCLTCFGNKNETSENDGKKGAAGKVRGPGKLVVAVFALLVTGAVMAIE